MTITVRRKVAFAAAGLVMTTGLGLVACDATSARETKLSAGDAKTGQAARSLTAAQIAAGSTRVSGDSANTPVYLIRGYRENINDTNCADKWTGAVKAMRGWGWTGKFHRVGYYSTDEPKNCVRIAKGSTDTSIKELGKQLAQNIYANYSSKGQSVDIIAHSMGGLVARAAIAGYARHEQGWPPKLLIQDVVTLGTPHQGAIVSTFCASDRQCREMGGMNSFMNWIGTRLPQADGGTDWTLIATDRDRAVNATSAAPQYIGAQHRVRYAGIAGLRHSDLRTRVSGHYRLNYSLNDAGWRHIRNGAPPIRVAMDAVYWSSKW